MMTPNMLERASAGFRRGYNDSRSNRLSMLPTMTLGTFAHADYKDGWDAAKIDRRNVNKLFAASNPIGPEFETLV